MNLAEQRVVSGIASAGAPPGTHLAIEDGTGDALAFGRGLDGRWYAERFRDYRETSWYSTLAEAAAARDQRDSARAEQAAAPAPRT